MGNEPSEHRVRVAQIVRMAMARKPGIVADLIGFAGLPGGAEHVAIGLGARDVARPMVRVHSECLTGDVFGSLRCDCGAQLDEAIERIAAAGGYILYLRQEGRGIGLSAKIAAYALQDAGLDTYQANAALGFADDLRDYAVAADMLAALGVSAITLLSNNPVKARGLRDAGIDVAPARTGSHVTNHNRPYLAAKRGRGHQLDPL